MITKEILVYVYVGGFNLLPGCKVDPNCLSSGQGHNN